MATLRQIDMTTSARAISRNRSTFFPPIALDLEGPTPIYRQVYDWFQRAIVAGRLRPGQRVPSTRTLAADLKVSRIPVLTAYEQLLAEGYLETFKGAGTSVAASIPQTEPAPSGRIGKPAAGLASRRPSRPLRLARRVEQAMIAPIDVVPPPGTAFGACQPALAEFPLEIWSSLLARRARRMSVSAMGYATSWGNVPCGKPSPNISAPPGRFVAMRHKS